MSLIPVAPIGGSGEGYYDQAYIWLVVAGVVTGGVGFAILKHKKVKSGWLIAGTIISAVAGTVIFYQSSIALGIDNGVGKSIAATTTPITTS